MKLFTALKGLDHAGDRMILSSPLGKYKWVQWTVANQRKLFLIAFALLVALATIYYRLLHRH